MSEFEIVFTQQKGFEKRPLEAAPRPGATSVVVRPKYVGICGSDLHLIEGHQGELRLGHEWVGVVEAVGSNVSGFRPGDVATSTGTLSCFHCDYCEKEETHLCDHAEYLSSDRIGALRTWMCFDQSNLVKVPGQLSQAQVIHEVVGVAEEALRLVRRELETLPKEVLILGGGPIGAMIAVVAKDSGLHPIVIEKREHRCAAVKRMGLECLPLGMALIDPAFASRFQLIVDATNDGAGSSGGFRNLPAFATKGFVAIVVGKYLKNQEIPYVFNRMGGRLVWMRGMPHTTLQTSIPKWGPRLEELARNYVSETFPVSSVADAFELALSRKSSMKVVVSL